MELKVPLKCPSCESILKVQKLKCESCGTEVAGLYSLPLLARLEPKDQQFITEFVKSSGSLKVMAQNMGLSYPTVRNLLDSIIEQIRLSEKQNLL